MLITLGPLGAGLHPGPALGGEKEFMSAIYLSEREAREIIKALEYAVDKAREDECRQRAIFLTQPVTAIARLKRFIRILAVIKKRVEK